MTKVQVRILKAIFIASLLGMAIGLLVYIKQSDGLVAKANAEWLGCPVDVALAIAELFGQEQVASQFRDSLFTTFLPLTAGLSIAAQVSTFLCIRFGDHCIIDRFWKPPPDIINQKLERDGAERTDPFAANTPFLERSEEIAKLQSFAGPASGDGPAWAFMTGREAVGKTRLAIEWLKRLEISQTRSGWDVGFLETSATALDVQRAQFRKPTAIVIDEARRRLDLWQVVAALLEHKQKIRILLVDQVPELPPDQLGLQLVKRLDEGRKPDLILDGISNLSLRELAPDLSEKKLQEAEGRPFYVLLGEDVQSSIAQRADMRFALAKSHNEVRALMLSALAGPIPHSIRKEIPDTEVSPKRLAILLENEPLQILRKLLPGFGPEPMADDIVLRCAENMTDTDLETFIRAAIAANPAAVERRCWSLWSRKLTSDHHLNLRDLIQGVFDDSCPERVEAMCIKAEQALTLTILSPAANHKLEDADFQNLETAYESLRIASTARPFDRRIRLAEASAAVNATKYYAVSRRPRDLKKWDNRLTEILNVAIFKVDREFKLKEIKIAVNAILGYASTEQFDDLNRWESRLDELLSIESFGNETEYKIQAAKATLNALNQSALTKHFEVLERWERRLAGLITNEEINFSREIRLQEENVAINVINYSGDLNNFRQMQLWENRLDRILSINTFNRDRDFRFIEASNAVNAVKHYGLAERFEDLEPWEARLDVIVNKTPFMLDREIRLEEAKAAVNAINYYGAAKRFKDLERWESRLAALLLIDEFSQDRDFILQEAKAAVNAFKHYGSSKRFEDMRRWEARLDAVLAMMPVMLDREIRLQEARAAVNTIKFYGEVRRFKDIERWERRLTKLLCLSEFKADREFKVEEAKAAANAIRVYYNTGHQKEEAALRWRERLSRIALAYPYDSVIQEQASVYGLAAFGRTDN